MKQKEWRPGGWRIMFTGGQGFGLGFWTGGTWIAVRLNGLDVHFGWVTLTIVPPCPQWLRDEEIASGH